MQTAWQNVLTAVERALGPQVFETWFQKLECRGVEGDFLVLSVPNRYYSDWITDNYRGAIEDEVERVMGRRLGLRFVADADAVSGSEDTSTDEGGELPGHFRLSPSQTFENFVVGSSNQFAQAAALNVAEAPARNYNPLFLFGGVGLGKTHLLNAIGNRIRQRQPRTRVVYLSAEEFMNEMINSLRYERMAEFREKYRQRCEVLLVDDIQFLEGKRSTLEEFFHTFNALHGAGRQIAVSSDKYPRELGIEERLRTRFEWGLVADIQPPELETRVAILKRKADAEQVRLPDDVAIFIASNVSSNVRKLEGTLTNLVAFSSFYGEPISLAFARRVLGDLGGDRSDEGPPSVERIQEVVARFFNLKVQDLKSGKRTKVLTLPRQIAMYLCRKHTRHSYPEIGSRFGGRDHSTVIHSVSKIEEAAASDADLRGRIESLERNLRS
ncbi:chromosomal replication initiator protein DnaA [Myxococcota bacterium]|nr:chromosomal replication initiator protein DnaA [Myxococcota bacterium]